jgi:hypothetical protein
MKREQSSLPSTEAQGSLSRREFLQAAGGGIVIFFTYGNLAA